MAPLAKDFPAAHSILPTQAHTHTIILLHGRNSNGLELAEELFEGQTSSGDLFASQEAVSKGVKWIFPNSRSTYSEQFQEDLTEWFDLPSTSNPHAEPERQIGGLLASIAHINSIIENEIKSVPANRILLGGISQGFATASQVLFQCPRQLGGFVGISGWLPSCLAAAAPAASSSTARIPMLITHSHDDEVIDVHEGVAAFSALRGLSGLNVVFKGYAHGGHEICEPQGFDDIQQFLLGFLGHVRHGLIEAGRGVEDGERRRRLASGVCEQEEMKRGAR